MESVQESIMKFYIQSFMILLVIKNVECIKLRTESCPRSAWEWSYRGQQFLCNTKYNETYHCILDDKDNLIETCVKRKKIPLVAGAGCPWIFESIHGTIIFGLPLSKCNVVNCPQRYELHIYSDELFKYPACLVPETERITTRTPSTVQISTYSTVFTTSLVPKTLELTTTPYVDTVFRVIAVSALVLVLLVIFIGSVVCGRYYCTRKYIPSQQQDINNKEHREPLRRQERNIPRQMRRSYLDEELANNPTVLLLSGKSDSRRKDETPLPKVRKNEKTRRGNDKEGQSQISQKDHQQKRKYKSSSDVQLKVRLDEENFSAL